MYYISKEIEVSASHSLNLSYDSPCNELHGHNWKIKVFCKSEELNKEGMIVDFTYIKKAIKDRLDHKNLNTVRPFNDPEFNSTAENIAYDIYESLKSFGCYRVEVIEVEGSWACYEHEGK